MTLEQSVLLGKKRSILQYATREILEEKQPFLESELEIVEIKIFFDLVESPLIDFYDESRTDIKTIKGFDELDQEVTQKFKIEHRPGRLIVSANDFEELTKTDGSKGFMLDKQILPTGQVYEIQLNVQQKGN